MLAAGLAVAAPASAAGLRDFRLGVVENELQLEDVDAMGPTRVGVLRVPLLWRAVESRRGGAGCSATYDWSHYDRLVMRASRAGVELLPILIGSPDYAAARSSHTPRSSAIPDYACFVRAAVERYGRRGVMPRLAGTTPIKEWQAWNEPNLEGFSGTPNPRHYGKIVKASHRAIAAEDRRAHLILAGLPEFHSAGMPAKRYLKQLYRVRRIKSKFDAVAAHTYARNHRGVEGALSRMRDLLRDLGDRRRPLWLTEVGFASDGDPSPFVSSERGQAKRLNKTYKMLRSNRKRFKLGTVTTYRWRDFFARTDRAWQNFAGLYNRDGTPKRACTSFVRYTGGRCRNIAARGGVAAGGARLPAPQLEVAGEQRPSQPER